MGPMGPMGSWLENACNRSWVPLGAYEPHGPHASHESLESSGVPGAQGPNELFLKITRVKFIIKGVPAQKISINGEMSKSRHEFVSLHDL